MPFSDIIGHSAPIAWLQRAIQSNHLAHAYLFVGDNAIGKKLTAIRLAQAISCDRYPESRTPDPCGICKSCYQIEAQTHPDFLFIHPDSEGQSPQIKIDRVREIEHHVIYRPLIGLRKICLIDEVDRLTVGAANAILKTLEEPPDHCLFLLMTNRPSSLLATITSRCLVVRFSPSSQVNVKNYLIEAKNLSEPEARLISCLSGGRVGEALNIDITDARARKDHYLSLLSEGSLDSIPPLLDIAEAVSKTDEVQKGLNEFWYILRDLLLVTLKCNSSEVMYREDIPTLQTIAKRTSPMALLNILNELQSLEFGLHRNHNMQLGFERFLVHLHDAISGRDVPAPVE